MFQIEVKRWLVAYRFPPSDGWDVVIDIDAMERGIVGQHPREKKAIAAECESWLINHGARVVRHPVFGRADLVATSADRGTFVVEVEGDSSKQPEQAMYSALGQLILSMRDPSRSISYILAVPDSARWSAQLAKIPVRVCEILRVEAVLVSPAGVVKFVGPAPTPA